MSVLLGGEESEITFIDHGFAEMTVSLINTDSLFVFKTDFNICTYLFCFFIYSLKIVFPRMILKDIVSFILLLIVVVLKLQNVFCKPYGCQRTFPKKL